MTDLEFISNTKKLIDDLKSVCANYGLGNDGNEFKIISQTFLYKYMNDKFSYEAKKISETLAEATDFQKAYEGLSEEERKFLIARIGNKAPKLQPEHLISYLFNNSTKANFAETYFDGTLRNISLDNSNLYSIKTASGVKGVSSRKVKKTGLRIKSIIIINFDSYFRSFNLNGLSSPGFNVTLLFQT